MAKKNNYVAYDSNLYYTEEAEEWYKEYVAECESDGTTPMGLYVWQAEMAEMDRDDFFDNLRCEKYGRTKITGSVGCWDGRHEIMPVWCDTLKDAIWKCADGQDGFTVVAWKSKICVTSWNHDSRYHGPNSFVLRTEEKRETMYLY